ncbi:cation-translocating P-type ATPase [Xenophilus sp. Marseille-Q4582]|uniref:heavy metal translocating P-type ATPase n=1 Tax=Xenophilus sp. Marseille-Q4582 TaxID=2866600 RepID=UPI001CE406BB|nr:cation-translocating P-type ATPase [Xenophilus sp. Marseille-Q4582]
MSTAPILGCAGLPTGAERQAFARLDDPAEWSGFGRELEAGGRWESNFAVEGMTCAACSFTLEDALARIPGVQKVVVSAASRRARLVWSPGAVRPSRWLEAVAQLGYRLLPAGDASLRLLRQQEARRMLFRWLVAGLCMMQVMMYALPAYIAGPGDMTPDIEQLLRWASWVLSLPVMFFCCGPFFRSAWRDLRRGRIGMDVPVALGMAIAFGVSTAGTFDPQGPFGHEVYFDSLTMFVFFLLTGRWLEARLRERTAGALDALGNRLPEQVERQCADGSFEAVAPRRLRPGDVLRVKPGEAFAADGVVIEGDTLADEALLTGESRPVPRPCGARVHAGSHNLAAVVLVRATSVGASTRFGQIVALMDEAATQRPRLAQLADRIASPFLAVVLLAAFGAVLWWWPTDPGRALMIAVSVLIVTCPCALSLATPAAMLASAGALARRGVLVGRLQALEPLAAVDTLVFDKTGTLTRDTPRLARIYSRRGMPPGEALARAAALAQGSLHPASRALAQAWAQTHGQPPAWRAGGLQEQMGQGVQALLQHLHQHGGLHRLGSAAYCGVERLPADLLQVHLADEQGWLASFALEEDLRTEAPAAVQALSGQGVEVQLLSGDRAPAAAALAAAAGIAADRVRGDCAPEDKLASVKQWQAEGHRVAMVGDGLNDGPVLAQADASFAFGQAVPLAQARADFVVLADDLSVIPLAVAQARRTLRVVRQNLAWSAAYNLLSVPFALMGLMPAWLAGLGMAASSVLVVLNSTRVARDLPAPPQAQEA